MTPDLQSLPDAATDPDMDAPDQMVLTFDVAGETYGLPIGAVTEIVGMPRLMPVPGVPAWIKGVTNLRGRVVPLMDVRLRFGLAERPYDDRTVVIVLDVDEASLGLIVDSVGEVSPVPPSGEAARTSRLVTGMGQLGDRTVVLLDATVLATDTGEME